MGLDAFLFEDEGILLSRGCGTVLIMFFHWRENINIKNDNRKFWMDVSICSTRL